MPPRPSSNRRLQWVIGIPPYLSKVRDFTGDQLAELKLKWDENLDEFASMVVKEITHYAMNG